MHYLVTSAVVAVNPGHSPMYVRGTYCFDFFVRRQVASFSTAGHRCEKYLFRVLFLLLLLLLLF